MRLAIATVVMLIISIVLGRVLGTSVTATASADYAAPQFSTALLGLFSATCGGFIARRASFALIGMAAYAFLWFMALYFVRKLVPDATYGELIPSNAIPIAISLSAVCVGSLFGYNLSCIVRTHGAAT